MSQILLITSSPRVESYSTRVAGKLAQKLAPERLVTEDDDARVSGRRFLVADRRGNAVEELLG